MSVNFLTRIEQILHNLPNGFLLKFLFWGFFFIPLCWLTFRWPVMFFRQLIVTFSKRIRFIYLFVHSTLHWEPKKARCQWLKQYTLIRTQAFTNNVSIVYGSGCVNIIKESHAIFYFFFLSLSIPFLQPILIRFFWFRSKILLHLSHTEKTHKFPFFVVFVLGENQKGDKMKRFPKTNEPCFAHQKLFSDTVLNWLNSV